MRHELASIIEQDGEWYIEYCPEIPGANGQGRTVEECRQNLTEAFSFDP
jgi:predicted RNase H-like HicB family nuclease